MVFFPFCLERMKEMVWGHWWWYFRYVLVDDCKSNKYDWTGIFDMVVSSLIQWASLEERVKTCSVLHVVPKIWLFWFKIPDIKIYWLVNRPMKVNCSSVSSFIFSPFLISLRVSLCPEGRHMYCNTILQFKSPSPQPCWLVHSRFRMVGASAEVPLMKYCYV